MPKDLPAVNTVPPPSTRTDPHRRVAKTGSRTWRLSAAGSLTTPNADQAVLGDLLQQVGVGLTVRSPQVSHDPEQPQMHIDGERSRAIAAGQPLLGHADVQQRRAATPSSTGIGILV